MAAKKKARSSVSSNESLKSVDNAIASLLNEATSISKAVIDTTKNKKKLLAESKRLAKKLATLMKKKKTARAAVNKDSSAANRKAVKSIEKDISANKKEAAKITAEKSQAITELSALKVVSKRASVYVKALTSADKGLNKPKRKRKKKKAVKVNP